jgi:hypothetical protein
LTRADLPRGNRARCLIVAALLNCWRFATYEKKVSKRAKHKEM